MDFCNKKCCFGENKCTSFGTNSINIVGSHKVCNAHLLSITNLPVLQCSYCKSICKITLDCTSDSACSTCQLKNPQSYELNLKCGHFHCESCIKTCGNKIQSSIQRHNIPNLEAQTKSSNLTSNHNFANPSKTVSARTIQKKSPEPPQKHSSFTLKPRICPNCGDKMQEKSLKCGHIGCLGCYNLKPCIFCKVEEKPTKIFPPCMNCNKTLKELRFICGHYGCEGCSFEQECRNCKKAKNKRCENCGMLEEPIPFECQHFGCLKCWQRPCSICYIQNNYEKKYTIEGNTYFNNQCQSCLQYKNLSIAYCKHKLCDTCIQNCPLCLKNKCTNCMQRFSYHGYKGCEHKMCFDCMQGLTKCRKCFKNCKCCYNLLSISMFKRNQDYCESCLEQLINISSVCELCHYDRISFELKIKGRIICANCEEYALGLDKGILGSALCQYCGEVSGTKIFQCNHKCCIWCNKNKGCFDCLANKKVQDYQDARNGRELCANCSVSTKKVINLLCDHSLCQKCFHKNYLYFDYRCKNCVKRKNQVRCIHCRNYGIWDIYEKFLIKSCCKMKVCLTCNEHVMGDYHRCKEDKSSCKLF